MTEPDEDPAIATLLEEAAQLATAANEKLGEALAIAERDAGFNEDQRWFKSRLDRSFRARLATTQEIEDLHSSGRLAGIIWAIVRGNRTGLETLYFVLPVPKRDELRAMWGRAAVEIARGTGQ